MRQQTFILVSPYMQKGAGYDRFKSRWRFGWEQVNIPELKQLTAEEIETIKSRHSTYIKPKK